MRKQYTLKWGSHRLELGERTCVMGVVNVTPDSFSDGGRFYSPDAAIDQGEKLIADGADILDIGGESTRPFSDEVSERDELERVIPVIEVLAGRTGIPISIDTTKAAVARRALEAGASIINDVSALRVDPQMTAVAVEFDVPVMLMHMLGTPKTMQESPVYDDVVADIKQFLDQAVSKAVNAGIARERIIIDPGIGFGKTLEHNLLLINNVFGLQTIDLPILIGPSRKAFLRNLLKEEGIEDISPDLPIVETGTQAAVAVAVTRGAHIVRVHDVADTRATVKIVDAIVNA